VDLPLLHLRATSASFPPACRPSTGVRRRLHPRSRNSSLKLPAPTAFPDPGALLCAPYEASERHTWPLRSPALRVWLPSRRCQLPRTLESLFQLPTLLGFPLQSFLSSPVIRPPVSQKTFPSCTSPKNPSASRVCFRGLRPPKKLGLSSLPEGLVRGETVCSPEVFGPAGFPSAAPRKRASPSSPSPLALGSCPPLEEQHPWPQGLPASADWLLLPKEAPPCPTFLTDNPVPPL